MKTQQQLFQKGSGLRDIHAHIHFTHNIPGNPRTILTWRVSDQTKLFGIISRLNNLNLPFLEVIFITEEGGSHV